mmetsp:Transcript_18698/g.24343  ORF Transcript_18698/g.24343 Transcript_18698/m.24343 type:complete len:507 (-) Transcript_18698:197-1717(-)
MNINDEVIDFERQRRKMMEMMSGYKTKISKLEASLKNGITSPQTQSDEMKKAFSAVASLREKFQDALSEADARAARLEEDNQALENQLQEYEARIKFLEANGGGAAEQAVNPEYIPAHHVQHHTAALAKATGLLGEINPSLGPPNQHDEENSRSRALFELQRKLFQLHVKFIHAEDDDDLSEHADIMEQMDEEEMELALFWFRGSCAALGGVLRGKQPMQSVPQSPEVDEDEPVNIAWGEDDEEEQEQVWESEEEDDPIGGHRLEIEPFMNFVPHYKRNLKLPELDSFDYIAQHADEYVGPSDESNWVLPGVFLVGAFPGCPDDDENWDLITGILALGVTTFVCLQDEYSDDALEEDWRYERNGAIRPYYRDVQDIVAQVEECPEDFPDIHISTSDLHFVHFPIIDCDIAEDDSVYGLANRLVDRLNNGEVIYLHCWGGHGRAGTVVSIMLHLMYGLGAKAAMERCQFVHDLRRVPMEVPSPQKPSQRNQVRRIVAACEEVEALDK